MKTRKYGIFETVDGEAKLLQEGSVRFSRANRAALKASREGHKGVFFAYDLASPHNKPLSIPQQRERLRAVQLMEKVRKIALEQTNEEEVA